MDVRCQIEFRFTGVLTPYTSFLRGAKSSSAATESGVIFSSTAALHGISLFSRSAARGTARSDASEQLELFSRVDTWWPEGHCRIYERALQTGYVLQLYGHPSDIDWPQCTAVKQSFLLHFNARKSIFVD